MRWAAFSCLLVGGAVPSTSLAADATEPIRIEYRAEDAAGCPSRAEFEAQVFARTVGARSATEGERVRTFIVELRQEGARVAGSLVVEERDGATMARRVSGSRCLDVARVLALATALAIDPRAELAPRQTLEELSAPEPPPESGPPSNVGAAASREPAPAVWTPRLALGVSASFLAAPKPALGASMLLGFDTPRVTSLSMVGLELVYRQAGSGVVRDASARFHFYVARPTLCALGVALAVSLRVAPCAVVEAGGVTGIGSGIPNQSSKTRFWVAGDVLLRLELDLSQAWFVTLEGGAQFPLTRYRFVFENPNTKIHDVPVLTATSALRVGASF